MILDAGALLVTAHRRITDFELVRTALEEIASDCGPVHRLAHGCAAGGDQLADRVALLNGWEPCRYAVDPRLDGDAIDAPHRRNERMLRDFDPSLVVAFWSGQQPSGTFDCMQRAARLGYMTVVVPS